MNHHWSFLKQTNNPMGINSKCFQDIYWLSSSQHVLATDSKHTCTSLMPKDVFLSLIVNKTQSAEKAEGRPIDKWKWAWWALKTAVVFRWWCLINDYLLLKLFTVQQKKERRSWYQADSPALLDLVYLKSVSNTCLSISVQAGMSALRFLAHKGSHSWQIWTWNWHIPILF